MPKSVLSKLEKEFRLAHEKMAETDDPFKKVYFFSAFYGETGRAMNQAYSRDLALLHLVLTATYQAMNSRLQSVTTGSERGIEIPETLFPTLTNIAGDLATWISAERGTEDFYVILSRLAELSYVTTGNGYYLLLKGDISL